MQKTKIEWTDAVWNPITGCLMGCGYCYARKISKRFKKRFPNGFLPTFYPDRLNEPYKWRKRFIGKRNDMVFAISMGDFFGVGIDRKWQDDVLSVISGNPDIIFQILTKQPQRIPIDINYPKNLWLGVSVSGNMDLWRIQSLVSSDMMKCHSGLKFISFEPLYECIYLPDPKILKNIGWVIFGIQTNPLKIIPYDYIDRIYKYANDFDIPVFVKNSICENYSVYGVTKEKNQRWPVRQWEIG